MSLTLTELGYELQTPQYTVFFGGVKAQLNDLKAAYPQVEFVRLKQIHSDAVIASKDSRQDLLIHADAHYTDKKDLGLCVITADCIPVFLFHPGTGLIAGIHAGWRGVANKIVPKTIHHLKMQGADPAEMQVIVGPHIQKKSFEVEGDVRDQILQSIGPEAFHEDQILFERVSEKKYLVDLNEVLKAQLALEGISQDNLSCLYIDTFANPDFHSYRRDKEKSGRQISFIVKK